MDEKFPEERNARVKPSLAPLKKVAAILLLRDDGAVLMQHRDDKPGLRYAGMWVPPGGHAEPGEAMDECARREFREETGYHCEEMHRLASLVDDPGGKWPAYDLTMFWARYDGKQPVECHEGQGVAFLERKEAGDYPVPAFILDLWDEACAAQSQAIDAKESRS
jgi:8-oxo-dGTP pyrophosphatase MutT (NUDIX family)